MQISSSLVYYPLLQQLLLSWLLQVCCSVNHWVLGYLSRALHLDPSHTLIMLLEWSPAVYFCIDQAFGFPLKLLCSWRNELNFFILKLNVEEVVGSTCSCLLSNLLPHLRKSWLSSHLLQPWLKLPYDQMVLAQSMGILPVLSLVANPEHLLAFVDLYISRPDSSQELASAGVDWLLEGSALRFFLSSSASSSQA